MAILVWITYTRLLCFVLDILVCIEVELTVCESFSRDQRVMLGCVLFEQLHVLNTTHTQNVYFGITSGCLHALTWGLSYINMHKARKITSIGNKNFEILMPKYLFVVRLVLRKWAICFNDYSAVDLMAPTQGPSVINLHVIPWIDELVWCAVLTGNFTCVNHFVVRDALNRDFKLQTERAWNMTSRVGSLTIKPYRPVKTVQQLKMCRLNIFKYQRKRARTFAARDVVVNTPHGFCSQQWQNPTSRNNSSRHCCSMTTKETDSQL